MIDLLSSPLPNPGIASASVAAGAGSGAPPGGADSTADAVAGAAMPSFGQTLGQFLDARDATLDRSLLPPPPRDGQEPAADGKDLPGTKGDVTPDDALPLAWFPAFVAPLPTITASLAANVVPGVVLATTGSPKITLPAVSADGTNGAALPPAAAASEVPPGLTANPAIQALLARTPSADRAPNAAQVPGDARPAPPSLPVPSPVATASPVTMSIVAVPAATSASTIQPAPIPSSPAAQATVTDSITTPRAAPAQPLASAIADARSDSAITVSMAPQPAGQVFAAAIATATSWRDRAARNSTREPGDDAATLATATPIALQERAMVHATGDAQGSALDLTKDSGLQRMIDRIETLRDGADASDTRIRLVPDALGSVDIAVRQEGDRVHVRFTAEQDATRALIANAQPRLTELAAARGVRIGDTSVGGGGSDTASNSAFTPQPRPAPPPPRAPRAAATDTANTTDQRLA